VCPDADAQGLEVFFMRVKIIMACTECKQRNYNTMKNKKNDPDRIEMKKYCKFCHKHTLHKETK
jgi:large subunit ribosomal protein L33